MPPFANVPGLRWATVLAVLAPGPWNSGAALAGRAVIISEGTAEPVTQAVAAALALFPIVAVAVFALARWLVPQR